MILAGVLLLTAPACSDSSSGTSPPPAVADGGSSSDAATDAPSNGAIDSGQPSGDASPAGNKAGPEAACAATIAAFTACGGTLVPGAYKTKSICSPAKTVTNSPQCPDKGTTTFFFDGLLGVNKLDVAADSLGFEAVRSTGHYTSDGPQSCFPNNADCRFTQTALYGTAPVGSCKVSGTDCHCEWTAPLTSEGTGTSSTTNNGNTLTWFGKAIPYCVSGTTLTLDLAAVFNTEPLPPGPPMVATFEKQ